jgi:hypothetical protein
MPEDSPPTSNPGFGLRMEKVLRAAQREAAEIIANAEQDAAALMSRVRIDVEAEDRKRRQDWVERERAVAEAVRSGAEEVAAAHRQATEIVDAAEHEAQRIRGHAHNRAAEINAAAEAAAEEQVRLGQLEVERLERVRDAARADLERLVRTMGGMRDALAYELETRPAPEAPAPGPPHRPGPPAGGIGNRPGDFRRARTAGIVSDPDPAGDSPVRRSAHEPANRN